MSCNRQCKSDDERFREAFQFIGNVPIPEIFRRLGWFMALHVCVMFVIFCSLPILMACICVQAMLGYI